MKRRRRPKKKPKPSPRRHKTRRSPVIPEPEVILPVAVSEFSRRGYQRSSLGQIAKQLGFGPHTIARRYPTKEALGLAVLEWQVGHGLKAFPKDSFPEPTRSRLEHALDAFIRCYLDHNGLVARLAAELWKVFSRDHEARLRLSWIHAQWQALVQEILEAGIKKREIHPALDPSTAATALVAACEGMALRAGILGEAIAPETFRASLVELIMPREARSFSGA